MIGLDTNILLRATLNDDPVQSPLAQRFLQSLGDQQSGFVNMPVLMEFFWVLRSRYKLPHARLAGIMRELLEVEHLEFEALETIGKAIALYEGRVADFPDALIAEHNRVQGCSRTITFDRRLALAVPSMELLA